MKHSKPFQAIIILLCTIISIALLTASSAYSQTQWHPAILPPEHKTVIDETSGEKIIYVTTSKASDTNLYFHDRCWLSDEKMMLFYSDRTGRTELFGYLIDSGELVALNRPQDHAAMRAVASKMENNIYVVRENIIYKWHIERNAASPTVTENRLCAFPEGLKQVSGLNESCDGKWISYGYKLNENVWRICVADARNGETRIITELGFPVGHIQFSRTAPNLLSFCREYPGGDRAPAIPDTLPHARIWFLNIDTGAYTPAFYQQPDELVTHECFWVNNLMTFCGGHRREEAHVKTIDLLTGEIRIIGTGAWWEGGAPEIMSKYNWWHASGSPDGNWVAADNWHGIIALFNARTTEMKILTRNHRTYGSGAHPHVGWDLSGKRVEFTSNKFGNPDVCVAIIPNNW
ncbi:hypothetical protein JXJ21_12910 [candidate division KSB1 bacterium]|nr:hypothetical protein [candidate division KSB1 bacterium]